MAEETARERRLAELRVLRKARISRVRDLRSEGRSGDDVELAQAMKERAESENEFFALWGAG